VSDRPHRVCRAAADTIRTTDDESSHSYDAYGALWLLPDGVCRGSALEVAPDGLQAAFTRNGRWRAGADGALDPHFAPGDPTPPAAFQDRARACISFDYDYAGSLYQ
jgi:hypothetical protein